MGDGRTGREKPSRHVDGGRDFRSTSTKHPAGRAQVSLTIDNTDHALDIDYTEVTIGRTLYRNGGSEYAINGSACRLLDIKELLSDSGLGQ